MTRFRSFLETDNFETLLTALPESYPAAIDRNSSTSKRRYIELSNLTNVWENILGKQCKKRGSKERRGAGRNTSRSCDAEEVADADDEEDSEQTDESAEVDLGDSDLELETTEDSRRLMFQRKI